jgi:NADH-quinone oxidoreductase subunit E
MALPDSLIQEFEELVKKYPQRRAGLIPALHRCQEDLGGWISPEIMEDLAEFFGLEPIEVYGVASFYPMFKLRPQGKHVIGICENVACDLRGSDEIIEQVCELTGAPDGGTSEDGKFTVERLQCQGACSTAPMFDLNGVYHEELDADKVAAILGELK